MDKNRYVAAWNELKSHAKRFSSDPVADTIDALVTMLEKKHGIPNKEVEDVGPESKEE